MKKSSNYKNLGKLYDEEYFEKGLMTGKSCYKNYHWMPEGTIAMAFYMIKDLPVTNGSKILDFGCAKGYLVKAFRILGLESYGVDISEYAISKVDKDVEKYCKLCQDVKDIKKIFGVKKFDWIIAKDVFEHIPEKQLSGTLEELSLISKKIFLVIPLGRNDSDQHFIVSEYNKDITHFTAKTDKWWRNLFRKNNLKIERVSFSFRHCKENWTSNWPNSNAFYILESPVGHNVKSINK
jgi:SAM-dependent methyltransferase